MIRKPLAVLVACSFFVGTLPAQAPQQATPFGYLDFSKEAKTEASFLAVPDAKLAGEELKILTAEPHIAASPEDHKTAEYVAEKFKAAGLETEIVPYRVRLNRPKDVRIEAYGPDGKLLVKGPAPEHVGSDPFENDPRVVMPFNGSSGSGDVTGEVVYANYGRLEDFDELAAQHVDLHGKIVITRYGANFRGVKVMIAQQRGAAGVLIYSDPQDDGYFKGDVYPNGPWRPESAVQRGSVQFLSMYPGDSETPGVASTLDLPDSARKSPEGNEPKIPSIPISYHDAAPILQALKGASVPQGWQGALPFRYHVGQNGGQGVKVHMVAIQDYQRRIIWDVIGKVKGSELPDDLVVAGNHRDAWVYGAVDPNSGTAAMLEAVHGVGELLKQGWKPKRTMIFCSWDAEEEGLIGSTEWVEEHDKMLEHAVAYFNTDVAVSGPSFSAAAVPSLKQFIREVTKAVPSPAGGTVYEVWKNSRTGENEHRPSNAPSDGDVRVGDLGSGSDFTPFFQHVGVPSTDVGSGGPYGVYHSVFDNYAWFTMNADPHFVYLQEMARVFGLEAIRMANVDVLPYDYPAYAREIQSYVDGAKRKAADEKLSGVDLAPVQAAAQRFADAAKRARAAQSAPGGDVAKLNKGLREAEAAFISPAGLPRRPWFKHTIYAPGEFTGYAAVVIPGVNEAIEAKDGALAEAQAKVLIEALDKATAALNGAE
ncbi:M28 family metallopeptidase [Terracidiphilus sp.]|jgi:N-acetylated-alpha-linked acidic dipeptidase|uniref:M28 family metallopeptidase n=1 Tax=Terracidiphilus sp. TaxID=1964191 RepID=UPI003C29A80B